MQCDRKSDSHPTYKNGPFIIEIQSNNYAEKKTHNYDINAE